MKLLWERVKNIIVPTSISGSIGMHQRIIVIGMWVSVANFFVAVIIAISCSENRMILLLEELCIGVSCSMVVVIVTTILQFIKLRDECFEKFYLSVFSTVSFYSELVLAQRTLTVEEKTVGFRNLHTSVEDYQSVPLLYWFSLMQEEAYLKVYGELTKIYSCSLKNEVKDEEESKRIIESIVDNMVIISEKYYSDRINIFKLNNFSE